MGLGKDTYDFNWFFQYFKYRIVQFKIKQKYITVTNRKLLLRDQMKVVKITEI